MTQTAWIVGGAAAVLGLLWLRNRQAQQQKPASACDALCTSAGDPGGHAVCVVGCNAAGGVLGAIGAGLSAVNPFHDSNQDAARTEASRDDTNKKLNGDVELALPMLNIGSGPHAVVAGTVARFKNGCTPFYGTPGFAHCNPGTESMWSADIAANDGDHDTATLDQVLAGVRQQPRGKYQDTATTDYELDTVQMPATVHPELAFTGAPGDPFTGGPVSGSNADKSPAWVWTIAGKRVNCPVGQAPAEIIFGRAGKPCPPELVGHCLPQGYDTNQRTSFAGCPPPAGFTWNPPGASVIDAQTGQRTTATTWFLSRLHAGQAVNDGTAAGGPCSNKSGVTSTGLRSAAAGTLAVSQSGFAAAVTR